MGVAAARARQPQFPGDALRRLHVAVGQPVAVVDLDGVDDRRHVTLECGVVGRAAAAAAVSSAASTEPTAFGLRPGLVDHDGPATDLLAVEARDRGPGFTLVVELDESETLRPAAVAVGEDADRFRRAARREQFLQLVFSRVV